MLVGALGVKSASLDRGCLTSGAIIFLHRRPPLGSYRLRPLDKQVSVFGLYFASSGQMPARGSYTTVRGLVVHGFHVTVDPGGGRKYLRAAVVSSFPECLGTGPGRRVRELLLLSWRWRDGARWWRGQGSTYIISRLRSFSFIKFIYNDDNMLLLNQDLYS